jgi:hypothetical protein
MYYGNVYIQKVLLKKEEPIGSEGEYKKEEPIGSSLSKKEEPIGSDGSSWENPRISVIPVALITLFWSFHFHRRIWCGLCAVLPV